MSAAITDIIVVYGKNPSVPANYVRIRQDMNEGAGGEYVYLCYTKDKNAGLPITDVQVFAGDKRDFNIQNYYEKVNGDLNRGAEGKYIYVCYSTEIAIPGHVTGLDVIAGDHRNIYPSSKGWVRVNQDCNEDARGKFIYVIHKSSKDHK